MGNSDSHLDKKDIKHTKVSRQITAPAKSDKRHSLSPSIQIPARSSSLKIGNGNDDVEFIEEQKREVSRRIQQRRAKSFRNPNGRGSGGSFRIPVCPITGLTSTQKKLVQAKWMEMDGVGILDMGRNVFETLFRREPACLKAIGLGHLTHGRNLEWRYHVNYRQHVKRFCEAFNEVIRSFEHPRTSIDQLQELGALHANTYLKASEERKVPSNYWDGLVFAINYAAKDLQVESSSRGSESPSNVIFDRRFLLPSDDLGSSTPPSPTQFSSLCVTPQRRSGSVCPRVAEAWNLLAIYAVSQMKFGYEMERLLQYELKKLEKDYGQVDSLSGSINRRSTGSEDGTYSSSDSPRSSEIIRPEPPLIGNVAF
ncbi:unnamed protein product [Bursaphelenchus xylophilus]|uniref:(pine wood nematode) hypothetical protein n=1 Tax=Bursaphelenchus xylophilus TaxID=6326 RepID=A0A1I7RRX1_BURXY|nr:unnamed protein product [Bursaphelenchus xylophilus]CAG9123421.1 unnamed protein product [Bursaphelenchus xylophilus]